MTRDDAINLIISLEGGYVNDPADPGGETNFGISKRAHPTEDIAGLTVERAREIYRQSYWNPTAGRLHETAPNLAALVFDSAVNQGPRAAVQMLQGVVGTVQDGVIGPMTIAATQDAVEQHGEPELLVQYATARALRYVDSRGWDRYGKGWLRRLNTVLVRASATTETHGLGIDEVRAVLNRALDLLAAQG